MLSTGLIENIFWVKFSSRSTTQIAGLLFLEGSIHDIIIFSIFLLNLLNHYEMAYKYINYKTL